MTLRVSMVRQGRHSIGSDPLVAFVAIVTKKRAVDQGAPLFFISFYAIPCYISVGGVRPERAKHAFHLVAEAVTVLDR